MTVVRLPDQGRTFTDPDVIKRYLAGIGLEYDRWTPKHELSEHSRADDVLAAYTNEINALKARGGYTTADVIDVKHDTPGLDAMLAKFSREHWHDEDEVRFIIEGRGIFHIRPPQGPVIAVEVGPGDLLRVPRGTWHWFDLCADRRIRAIRLFQNPAGWTPHYTASGMDKNYQPVCLGPAYIPPLAPTT